MNSIKSRSLLAALAIASAASFSALAQVNVTITGQIKEATCTPQLSGTKVAANSIELEPAQLSALDQAGKTTEPRTFTFAFSGCGFSTAINHMWMHFKATDVTGGRINTNNTKVAFQIMDVLSSGVTGNQVNVETADYAGTGQPGAGYGTSADLTGTFDSRAVSKSYIVQYYAKDQVDQAGSVTATVTYAVKYW